jgi:pimeloyl-ACP methyl ester carboxylesterase
MKIVPVFFRETGAGPAVICIHANASASGQWRTLMERLSDRFRMIAVDTYGAGKSPPWPQDRKLTLADEVALLEPVLEAAGERFHLVGHSYGGGIALKIALMVPGRVLSMALYEPTLFAVLEEEQPGQPAAREICKVVEDAQRALDRGDAEAAAERFIDYWMGRGSWGAMPEARRPALTAATRNIAGWLHVLLREPAPLSALKNLQIPVLLLTGAKTRESARGVARVLARTLPRVTVQELEGVGHMAPVTHPDLVNALIESWLKNRDGP